MQGSSDNSFIPKRGASKRKQIGGSRKIYIFSYVSYILMFATLLSAGGVFLYAQYVNSQLDVEIEALNSEIGSFSQADMDRVTRFDLRLIQAQNRLENSVSIASVFEALQAATIDTVQIESLEMKREGDDKFVINAIVQTDTFDSTIFQRGVFLRNNTIQEVDISEVRNILLTDVDETGKGVPGKSAISFQALLEIPLVDVPADPQSYQNNESNSVSTEIQAEDDSAEIGSQDFDDRQFEGITEVETINEDTI